MATPGIVLTELQKPSDGRRFVVAEISNAASGLADSRIKIILKNAVVQLPSLLTVAVVDLASAQCLGHYNRMRGLDPAALALHNAETVRQQQGVLAALSGRPDRLADILVPGRKHLHLIRVARTGRWFGYLLVKAQDTSLALAREVLKSLVT